MSQSWFKPHPVGIYPRGNAKNPDELAAKRFGSLSPLQLATRGARSPRGCVAGCTPTEEAFVELTLHLLSFCPVDDLCRLSSTCTAWYCFIHASDAYKQAHGLISPQYTCFHSSWKVTAIRAFLDSRNCTDTTPTKRRRLEFGSSRGVLSCNPIAVSRPFYSDHLFQAWMCTILPCHYHLVHVTGDAPFSGEESGGLAVSRLNGAGSGVLRLRSTLNEVPRCSHLTPEEFRARFEMKNLPVILTDVATEWPIFKILNGKFENLSRKRSAFFREGVCAGTPMRCEHTTMSVVDYVRYALQQKDERPIYMFDSEFGIHMSAESLYAVPTHFGRDDFFKVLGTQRPRYRWIVAGPRRGGSSFHIDPNYTSAWNANLTGRKRWILLPPGCTPPGVFPSEDMSEVATPVSLTEWLLNHYDSTVEQWRGIGYECICEPGDIIFVPCGWWHFVINLEDSVAITQNYVSECNLPNVIKFLSAMTSSISGIGEDGDDSNSGQMTEKRRARFAEEFCAAMRASYPDLMRRVESDLEREARERQKRKKTCSPLPLLASDSGGFTFDF
uniref:JmjC domain-containing protein n=1 Tax=Trypanosoma vivax (strain Y486) TaxID=1055687 RepID=G0UA81_TRYVY|nr:conserved hypothetical protein [Trypanosoma vivax Y486]